MWNISAGLAVVDNGPPVNITAFTADTKFGPGKKMTGAGISGNEAVKASNRIPYLPGPNQKNGDVDRSSVFGNGNSSGNTVRFTHVRQKC